MSDDETRRRHAAWLRECARRSDLLAAEYRANADRIDPDVAPSPSPAATPPR